MGAAEVKNKEGVKLIKAYQKKHRNLTKSKDDRLMRRLFNLYGGKKGYLDEQQAKAFIRDVLFVSELNNEVVDLQGTIDAIYHELDSTNSHQVQYSELLKPSWGRVQDLLNTVYSKMPGAMNSSSYSLNSGSGSVNSTEKPSGSLKSLLEEENLNLSELEECCPPSFICPISTEIMKDPVILVETGTTYDRSSILSWLKDHNSDPLNGLELKSKDIISVLALKNAIEEWKEEISDMKKKRDEKLQLAQSPPKVAEEKRVEAVRQEIREEENEDEAEEED